MIAEIETERYRRSQIPDDEKVISFAGLSGRETGKQNIQGNSAVIFTTEELKKLPKKYQEEFRTGRTVAHVRKKDNGSFEIRCQVNKINLSVASKFLDDAKARFVKKLADALSGKLAAKKKKSVTLGEYMERWLETVKKPYIKESSYNAYLFVYHHDIKPKFGKVPLAKISSFDIQEYLNGFARIKKFKTAEKVSAMLTSLFAYAVADDVITKSPMLKIKLAVRDVKHGQALTRDEEKALIAAFYSNPTPLMQCFILCLYTGLRRSEVASAEVSDNFITVVSAKQRKGLKTKKRKIPISPMLKTHLRLIDFAEVRKVPMVTMSCRSPVLIPGHHMHDLRHTFITRCQECGIPREVVSLWSGHVADSSITSTVYTHLENNEELQLREIAKFSYFLS